MIMASLRLDRPAWTLCGGRADQSPGQSGPGQSGPRLKSVDVRGKEPQHFCLSELGSGSRPVRVWVAGGAARFVHSPVPAPIAPVPAPLAPPCNRGFSLLLFCTLLYLAGCRATHSEYIVFSIGRISVSHPLALFFGRKQAKQGELPCPATPSAIRKRPKKRVTIVCPDALRVRIFHRAFRSVGSEPASRGPTRPVGPCDGSTYRRAASAAGRGVGRTAPRRPTAGRKAQT